MTLAAFELQNSAIKVIDLALKYGYESPEAFSRAFHHIHVTSPTLARDRGVYPRMRRLLLFEQLSRADRDCGAEIVAV